MLSTRTRVTARSSESFTSEAVPARNKNRDPSPPARPRYPVPGSDSSSFLPKRTEPTPRKDCLSVADTPRKRLELAQEVPMPFLLPQELSGRLYGSPMLQCHYGPAHARRGTHPHLSQDCAGPRLERRAIEQCESLS